jgi:hypothetical protein
MNNVCEHSQAFSSGGSYSRSKLQVVVLCQMLWPHQIMEDLQILPTG